MRFRRHHKAPIPPPRANPTAIAVLEHDLLRIQPEPGTAAALAIALRRTAVCAEHQPIDITCLTDPKPVAVCQGCGRQMIADSGGTWRIA